MSGLSTTWYTWVEQGRDISLSAAALARLADALDLGTAERAYLFELTRRRDPSPAAAGSALTGAPRELASVLRAASVPAYLLDRLWRVRDRNAAADRLFAPWFDSGEPCLLRYVLLDPTARTFICDWENRARRLIAEFRADIAHAPDDPGLCGLVEGLVRDSAVFARLWREQAVLSREGGGRTFDHPHDGIVSYDQVTLVPAAHPDHKLVMLLPETCLTP